MKHSTTEYKKLHNWLNKVKPRTGVCQKCGVKPQPYRAKLTWNGKFIGWHEKSGTDFANISGEYKRDPDDYIEVCKSCHLRMDGRASDASPLV